MRTLPRKYFGLLTSFVLFAGCGDGGEPDPTGGSGGTSNMTQPPLAIERPANAIEGEYIFFLKADAVPADQAKAVADELAAKYDGTVMDVFAGGLVGFSAKGLDDDKATAISTDVRVEALGQNGVAELSAIQSPAPSWGLDRIDQQSNGLDNKYEYYYTGKGVHAYVIDSGIRSTHQDFAGRIGPGTSFVFDGKGIEDCNGHGTHVAGILGGTTYGVAKNVTIHPVRIANCSGYLSIAGIIAGVDWVVQNHVKPAVINLSGGTNKYAMVDTAAANAVKAGITFVAAAGNPLPFGTLASEYSPGRTPEVMCVGAIGKDNATVLLTNYGPAIDIFAPGLDIVSADIGSDTATSMKTGTSMAAPHVAGMVAQFLEIIPSAPPSQVASGIYGGATSGLVKGDKTAANRILYTRFTDPAGSFINGNTWDTYYNDGGPWDDSDVYWGTLQYPDVNGDKKADICGRAQNGIVCEISSGTGFSGPQVWTNFFDDGGGWNLKPDMWTTIRFPDLNGDGKADICGRASSGLICGLSNGTSFDPITQWEFYYENGGPWDENPAYWGTMQFGDINGDGKDDICGRAANGIVCETSTGTSLGNLKTWIQEFADGGLWETHAKYWSTIKLVDVNGDGMDDVCGRYANGVSCGLSNGAGFDPTTVWTPNFADGNGFDALDSYWGTYQYADINGDKKMDVCARDSLGMSCALSTGTKFSQPTTWMSSMNDASVWATGSSYWGTIRLQDINGDKKADICGRRNDGIFCGLSTGSEFAFGRIWEGSFADNNSWTLKTSYWATVRFPDVNGDGKSDVCGRNMAGVVCAMAGP